jgi:hypothetical protein
MWTLDARQVAAMIAASTTSTCTRYAHCHLILAALHTALLELVSSPVNVTARTGPTPVDELLPTKESKANA